MMRFKVEIELTNGAIVLEYFQAKSVSELEDLVKKKFKTGKVLSIIGGGYEL